jgi:hypothetical protein
MIEKLMRIQTQFKPLRKTKVNPYFNSKYAGLDDVMESISETLAKNGLVISNHSVVIDDRFMLVTKLHDYETGASIETSFPIFAEDSQKIGASMTYGRRFNIVNLLNLVADEDLDGNDTQREPIQEHREKPKSQEIQERHQLLPDDVIPKWYWDLKKENWKEAAKYMPKGYGAVKRTDGIYYVTLKPDQADAF